MSISRKLPVNPTDSSEIMPFVHISYSHTDEVDLVDCFAQDYPGYFDGRRIFTLAQELQSTSRKDGYSAALSGVGVILFNQSELKAGEIPRFAAVRLPIAGSDELTNRFITTRAEDYPDTGVQNYCVGAIAKAAYGQLQNERQPIPGVLEKLGPDNDAFVRAFVFEDSAWTTTAS